MKRTLILLTATVLCFLLLGCGKDQKGTQIAATTLPVFDFTSRLCCGTDIQVTKLVTESVSCLHDYSLSVSQMQTLEVAEAIVVSGAGLEAFLGDALTSTQTMIDASAGIDLLCSNSSHAHGHDHEHSHAYDPHIWLSPVNAKIMASNIYEGLVAAYPEHAEIFKKNHTSLKTELDALIAYADAQLKNITCHEIITFHDGFAYMANCFGLHIVHAAEEESGSEASAAELIELIQIIRKYQLKTIFTERLGSTAAADIVRAETDVSIYQLDMAMSGDSYFDAMYHNINTLKEALE